MKGRSQPEGDVRETPRAGAVRLTRETENATKRQPAKTHLPEVCDGPILKRKEKQAPKKTEGGNRWDFADQEGRGW